MKVACLYFLEPLTTSSLTLVQIAELCLRLSPQICIGKDSLFIEIGKCHRLYTEDSFLRRIQVILKRVNTKAQVSIGETISEALVKAKYDEAKCDNLPLAALVDYADPLGKDLIIQKNVHKMVLAFSNLGVKTIFQFKKIPLSDLINRFGAVSVLCQQRLNKETSEPWPFWKPSEVIVEKSDFPYFEFYGELEPILFKLKEHLDRIFQRLWPRNLRVQKMQVRVFCETNSQNIHPFRHFEFDFITPQSVTKGTLNIIKERLAKDFEKNPVTTPIEAIETKILTTVTGTTGQKNLLHNHEEQLEQFHALLAQLAEAHGADTVFQAVLTEDRRPEKSWKKANGKNTAKSSPVNTDLLPLRPTYLVRPEKVEVTAGLVHIRKRRFKIIKWSQYTEHLSGDWLETASYDRSYYQIELEKAPMISIYETPDKKYFLHGYYG